MSKRESPQDTLQHYFDDLLIEDEVVHSSPAVQVAVPDSSKLKASKPRLVTAKRYAEPELEADHKQKVQRLLQGARPKLSVEVAEKPQAVEQSPELLKQEPLKQEPLKQKPPKVEVLEPVPATVAEVMPVEQDDSVLEDQPETEPDFEIEGLEWLDNGLPAWAQERFDVLLFKVSGLTLAVPLVSLGQIQPLNDELTPIFGQADWFMGLQPTPMGKIRTVNTAKFVMPERYDEKFLETARLVISINGLPWGLAVDSVNQPISLNAEDVKWRTERSKRPWLAGTVKEHMCALMDIPMMGKLLMEADKNLSGSGQ